MHDPSHPASNFMDPLQFQVNMYLFLFKQVPKSKNLYSVFPSGKWSLTIDISSFQNTESADRPCCLL